MTDDVVCVECPDHTTQQLARKVHRLVRFQSHRECLEPHHCCCCHHQAYPSLPAPHSDAPATTRTRLKCLEILDRVAHHARKGCQLWFACTLTKASNLGYVKMT